MDDAPYVFAKRSDRGDTQLEGIVLRTLALSGYVPRLKAVIDEWVVQEWVPGERLPVAMDHTADMGERKRRISEALECLIHIHNEAHGAKALEDLAYLLCDEWTNLDAQSEEELLKSYFPFFNRSLSQERGEHCLRLFDVTHMILRI